MAEVIIDGKKYETTLGGDGQYLTPPVLIDKPESISIDPMDILKQLDDTQFAEVATFLNSSAIAAGFFTRPSISLDISTGNRIQAIVTAAGLSTGTTAALTEIVNILKGKVKDV